MQSLVAISLTVLVLVALSCVARADGDADGPGIWPGGKYSVVDPAPKMEAFNDDESLVAKVSTVSSQRLKKDTSMLQLNEGRVNKIEGTAETWRTVASVSNGAIRGGDDNGPPLVALEEEVEKVQDEKKNKFQLKTSSKSGTVFGQGFAWEKIADPSAAFPYKALGRLKNGCTGALIGKKVVLTAAHCLYNAKTKVWNPVANVGFVPHQNGAGDTTPALDVAQTYISANFLAHSDYSPEWDWGVLVLTNEAPANLGMLGYKASTKGDVDNAGYPQSKNQEMWHDKCTLTQGFFASMTSTVANHKCDIEPGSSGSPMYDTANYIHAIQSGQNPSNNVAFIIQSSSFDVIKALIYSNGGR